MVSSARMKFDAEHLRIAEQVRKGAKARPLARAAADLSTIGIFLLGFGLVTAMLMALSNYLFDFCVQLAGRL
jgi:hypothetical protein